MKTTEITMVRIYLTEGQHQLEPLLKVLHDQERVRGVTAFRGIAGFGESGQMHSSGLIDLSLDLPLVVEFFDAPAKVASVLEHLDELIKPGHMVSWSAHMNSGE
jgi:PII-like signaling protein